MDRGNCTSSHHLGRIENKIEEMKKRYELRGGRCKKVA